MTPDVVQRLVVKNSHQLGICRLSIRLGDAEVPFFLLPRCQAVAECIPLQRQTLVGQGFSYRYIMRVHLSFLHPCVIQQHAVTIFFLVGQLLRMNGIAQIECTTLKHFVAGYDGIEHMHVFIRRPHLHVNGLSVAAEFRFRSIEPLVCLDARALVSHAEQHELLLYRVSAADGFQRVLPGRQRPDDA